jgi:hypothetical protein
MSNIITSYRSDQILENTKTYFKKSKPIPLALAILVTITSLFIIAFANLPYVDCYDNLGRMTEMESFPQLLQLSQAVYNN